MVKFVSMVVCKVFILLKWIFCAIDRVGSAVCRLVAVAVHRSSFVNGTSLVHACHMMVDMATQFRCMLE